MKDTPAGGGNAERSGRRACHVAAPGAGTRARRRAWHGRRPVTFRERSGAGAPPTSFSVPTGQLAGLACGGLGVRGREPRYAGVPAPAAAAPSDSAADGPGRWVDAPSRVGNPATAPSGWDRPSGRNASRATATGDARGTDRRVRANDPPSRQPARFTPGERSIARAMVGVIRRACVPTCVLVSSMYGRITSPLSPPGTPWGCERSSTPAARRAGCRPSRAQAAVPGVPGPRGVRVHGRPGRRRAGDVTLSTSFHEDSPRGQGRPRIGHRGRRTRSRPADRCAKLCVR